MARSYRKPVYSITCSGNRAGAQKSWKRDCNRRLRRRNRIVLSNLDPDSDFFFIKNEIGNIWSSPADGFIHHFDLNPKNPEHLYKLKEWWKIYRLFGK